MRKSKQAGGCGSQPYALLAFSINAFYAFGVWKPCGTRGCGEIYVQIVTNLCFLYVRILTWVCTIYNLILCCMWKMYLFTCTYIWCNIIHVQKITCILRPTKRFGGIRLHFANVLCRKREYRWNERNPLKSTNRIRWLKPGNRWMLWRCGCFCWR